MIDQETAIPVHHSFMEQAVDFTSPPVGSDKEDEATAELAAHPGWLLKEEKIKKEIIKLQQTERFEGEPMDIYGFRMYASQLCRKYLEWVINDVRGTANVVTERSTRNS